MKIFVLVKQVPDTETSIKVSGASIVEGGVKWIVSPFDEHALEESLRLREKTGGEITAVSLGPDRCVEALRTSYALGVDKAVHIKDESYNVPDTGYAARLLAAYLKDQAPDVVLTGHVAIDSSSSLVPTMVAQLMGAASINNAVELSVEGGTVKAKREVEGGTANMEVPSPAVVTAAKNLNDPRYPSLKGIMAAKKKQIETVEASSLGVEPPKIEVTSLEMPPARPEGRIIEGEEPEAKAAELVKLLRDEAKVV